MPTLCGHFCYMANYSETIAYFKNLCVTNLKIAHAASSKKFFRMNMEEFLSGSVQELPNKTDGAFMVFINYIGEYGEPTHDVLDTKQLMFYVLQGYEPGAFDDDDAARTNTEEVLEEIILKMRYDSQKDHVFFDHSYDQIKRTRRIPVEIRTSAGNYIGWQCSFYHSNPISKCHNPLNWLP